MSEGGRRRSLSGGRRRRNADTDAIEPGVYWPGGGGLRLEDNYLVTASGSERKATVKIANTSATPALMIKLTLKDSVTGARILPAYYSENYVSMLPGEERVITIEFPAGHTKAAIGLRGCNLATEAIAAE